jgi:hypothetical protein
VLEQSLVEEVLLGLIKSLDEDESNLLVSILTR